MYRQSGAKLRILETLVGAALILSAGACASAPPKVNIVPRDDGLYYVVAYSSDEPAALEAAVQKADRYCDTKNRHFVLAKDSSTIDSLADDAKKAADMAKVVLGEVLGKSTKAEPNKRLVYARSGDELVMTFKCIKNSED